MNDYQEVDFIESDKDFVFIDSYFYEFDQYGSSQDDGKAVGWGEVAKACARLLGKCRDIRVAIWNIRVELERGTFNSFQAALEVLVDFIKFPPPENQYLHISAESASETYVMHVAWLSNSQLVKQVGFLEIQEINVSIDEICKKGSYPLSLHERCGDASKVIGRVLNLLAEIDVWVEGRSADGASFFELTSKLTEALKALEGSAEAKPELGAVAEDASGSRDHNYAGESILRNRLDVENAIDNIVNYFNINEPSHPAPIILLKVKKMIGVSFSELMMELYSDGMALAEKIGQPSRNV